MRPEATDPNKSPEEINNISAGVFRREHHQTTTASAHLNEYFARNLNMGLGGGGQKMSSGHQQPHLHHLHKRSSPTPTSSVVQMLPIALCLITFASILSLLIIYIDTTEIRHQQFRLNMSRDYDLQGISQDNPVLVSYLREMHLKRYLLQQQQLQASSAKTSALVQSKFTAEMGEYVARELLQGRRDGVFIQSAIGTSSDSLMIAPYLVEQYQWRGLIVEPDPKKFFNYGKVYAHHPDVNVIHACFSPTGFPKEVTLHQEGAERGEVKISSVLDGEEEAASDWFENRVKCFSLYTLMLAVNETAVDLLSLSLHGLELQILKTLPFDRVQINVISLHFVGGEDQRGNYIQTATRFLTAKGFKLMKVVGHSYYYKTKRAFRKGN